MQPSAACDLVARLLEIHDEAAGARTFRLSVPDDFSFIPGMWVMIQFPDKAEQKKRITQVRLCAGPDCARRPGCEPAGGLQPTQLDLQPDPTD